MTESYEKSPAAAAARHLSAPGARRDAVFALLGLLQGVGLWLAGEPSQATVAFAWRDAAWYLLAALPLAWYLGDDAPAAGRRRIGVALAIGLLFALLGARAGTASDTPRLLATGVLGFTLVALSCAVPPGSRRPSYARLFETAWRNALALPLAGLLTGVLWMLLWAAAGLMHSIGLDGMQRLIEQPAFRWPVSCTVFALAMAAVLRRADLLLAVRRLWLTLNTWFLPLALAFALVWLASLAFTGIEPLFATRRAALFLFWFCLLSVVFANAAFQDGREAPALPRPVARACRWAWLAVPVLALLGDWALWQRVLQYGWTSDRIWAAVVGGVLTLHALGYAASLAWRRRWMGALPRTNIAVALVKVVVLLLLLSPLADSRRLAIDSQLARLLDGRVPVEQFDWSHLHQEPYGHQALDRLALLDPAGEPGRGIARRAVRERALWSASEPGPDDYEVRLEALRQVEVLPAGSSIDAALLEWLAGNPGHGLDHTCQRQPAGCLFWLTDLDRDGRSEVLMVSGDDTIASARLLARGAQGWGWQGNIRDVLLPLSQWRQAIDANRVEPTRPLWPDLLVNGQQVRISP